MFCSVPPLGTAVISLLFSLGIQSSLFTLLLGHAGMVPAALSLRPVYTRLVEFVSQFPISWNHMPVGIGLRCRIPCRYGNVAFCFCIFRDAPYHDGFLSVVIVDQNVGCSFALAWGLGHHAPAHRSPFALSTSAISSSRSSTSSLSSIAPLLSAQHASLPSITSSLLRCRRASSR